MKYKIEFTQSEKFMVDVEAESQEKAEELAREKFDAGDYQDMYELNTEISNVYDVTNTDDPFNP